jgi:SAM-dependent methyltransferase
MVESRWSFNLNCREKLFLRFFCYSPPGKEMLDKDDALASESDPLGLLKHYFGNHFVQSVKNKVVLDIGCGEGIQVVGSVIGGAKKAIGVEVRPVFRRGEEWAKQLKIVDRVTFALSPIQEIGKECVDVAISQNSFEHFMNPSQILNDVFYVLKRSGKFFITFGPPWLHAHGGHLTFMVRYPWAHLLFSEKTIMAVRKLFRNDNADRFDQVEGGLNKMTINKFKRSVKRSGFKLEQLSLTPVKGLIPLVKIQYIQEFFTTHISAILTKM